MEDAPAKRSLRGLLYALLAALGCGPFFVLPSILPVTRPLADVLAFAAFLCWALLVAKFWDYLAAQYRERNYAVCIVGLAGILAGTAGFLFQATWPIPLIADDLGAWAQLLLG